MSNASGGRRDFSSRVPKNPPKVTLGLGFVSRVPQQNLRRQHNTLGYTEQLMAERVTTSQDKPDYRIIDRYNKGCVRLTSKIVIGKEIGEQVPVLENWINRAT